MLLTRVYCMELTLSVFLTTNARPKGSFKPHAFYYLILTLLVIPIDDYLRIMLNCRAHKCVFGRDAKQWYYWTYKNSQCLFEGRIWYSYRCGQCGKLYIFTTVLLSKLSSNTDIQSHKAATFPLSVYLNSLEIFESN